MNLIHSPWEDTLGRAFLAKLIIAMMPVVVGGITYLFIDVITLRAEVIGQARTAVTLKEFLSERLDRIENKLDRISER